jgi:hypothetical protein
MSEQTLAREERIAAIIDEFGVEDQLKQLVEDAKSPKKFFVGEYDDCNGLIGLTTVATLEEAEQQINDDSNKEAQVIDLDTGDEHRVTFTATVERLPGLFSGL